MKNYTQNGGLLLYSPSLPNSNFEDRPLQVALDLLHVFDSGVGGIHWVTTILDKFELVDNINSASYYAAWGLLNHLINGYNFPYREKGAEIIQVSLSDFNTTLHVMEYGDGLGKCEIMVDLLNKYLNQYCTSCILGPTTLGQSPIH